MVPKYPGNINRDLKRMLEGMTCGVAKQIPVSCFKMPMMILKGENQGPEQRRNLIQVKYMQMTTPCPKHRAV